MTYSTLFQIHSHELRTEAEVETRLLAQIFNDLGYPNNRIIPKQSLPSLFASSGRRQTRIEADFLLCKPNGLGFVIVEAKEPNETVQDAWGQAASYALSYNRDKAENAKVKWLLISNGHITSLFPSDSERPIVTLQLSDFASGAPPYVSLRSLIKYQVDENIVLGGIPFTTISPAELNNLFAKCHDLVWKKEKLSPTDAFFEFCKFIFLKIKADKERTVNQEHLRPYELPLTMQWLSAQRTTLNHPVRDALFVQLRDRLEAEINAGTKRRIFEQGETFKLSADTTKELITRFENINLSSIDEDLNGRMFEVFLNSAVRGKELGQFFTPRPLVDFMTRIGLEGNNDITTPPMVIDASCGTSGFLIEVMAYLLALSRNDTRYTSDQIEEISKNITNNCLFGIEANERVSRIARINMYLHGDGGSHIFHGDGLDNSPTPSSDMSEERVQEVNDHASKIKNGTFDLVLTNPPFSMSYNRNNEDEERILRQLDIAVNKTSLKSNILFLQRYYDLLKPGGEMLIVLDDTVLNGSSQIDIRNWLLDKFIFLGIHSMPFNAFFKAKANIKTSVIHVRKKQVPSESQGHVFMSISNNIGHDNALNDTPERNNLNDILNIYLEWRRTGNIATVVRSNQDPYENLECPEQIWLVNPDEITPRRLDAFYYAPELRNTWKQLNELKEKGLIEIKKGRNFHLAIKLTTNDKRRMQSENKTYKYIEIGDVTKYGLITSFITGKINELPSRGDYLIKSGDILLALNNSSRGTVVLVPNEFDGAICTSGFLVIRPETSEEASLLWYSLRSEACRKQIYYLAQTASQPELKRNAWNNEFLIPIPVGQNKQRALTKSSEFFDHISALLEADNFRWYLQED
jgi:type I restriction enzyme M protein